MGQRELSRSIKESKTGTKRYRTILSGFFLLFVVSPNVNILFFSTEQEEEEGEEESRDVYAVRRTDYGEIADFKASDLGSRRLKLAQKVCLDAKFLSYTKRLSTHSVLLLPLRTPQAPLKGTHYFSCTFSTEHLIVAFFSTYLF